MKKTLGKKWKKKVIKFTEDIQSSQKKVSRATKYYQDIIDAGGSYTEDLSISKVTKVLGRINQLADSAALIAKYKSPKNLYPSEVLDLFTSIYGLSTSLLKGPGGANPVFDIYSDLINELKPYFNAIEERQVKQDVMMFTLRGCHCRLSGIYMFYVLDDVAKALDNL